MPATARRPIAAPVYQADLPIDAAFVTSRLEEAGETLLALPGTGYSTRLRTSSLDIVRTALENYGWSENRVRPPVPWPGLVHLTPRRTYRAPFHALGQNVRPNLRAHRP